MTQRLEKNGEPCRVRTCDLLIKSQREESENQNEIIAVREAAGTDQPHLHAQKRSETHVLACGRTGRFWRYSSAGQARNAARSLGLKDYSIEVEA